MRLLHFTGGFSKPTETFIKRYVQKSLQFAEVGIASFHFENVSEEIKNKLSLFEINREFYTRKTIKGAARYAAEQWSGMRSWYDEMDKAIGTFRPDIIHCHFGNEGIAMMQFEKKFKKRIPYVTSFYGYD